MNMDSTPTVIDLIEDMACNRVNWRKNIHVANPQVNETKASCI